ARVGTLDRSGRGRVGVGPGPGPPPPPLVPAAPHRGDQLPGRLGAVGLGLAWILAAGGGAAAGAALAAAAARAARGVGEAGLGEPGRLAVLAAWLFWAGLVGWVDDLLGDGSRRGLRGHGGALLQG